MYKHPRTIILGNRAGVTPENAALFVGYAEHLARSSLGGRSSRTYLGAVRAELTWLEPAEVDRAPLAAQRAMSGDREKSSESVSADRNEVRTVGAAGFNLHGFGEGDDPAHRWSGCSQSRRLSVGLTLIREDPPRF
jgi:hypothetical protein